MNFVIGLIIAIGSVLGGYAALGGHLEVLFQPYEFVIICGAALGIFIVANPMADHQGQRQGDRRGDHRQGAEAARLSRRAERAARADARAARQVAQPRSSRISTTPTSRRCSWAFRSLLANKDLVTFICDYGRLIIIGNAKTHEIEALMDEELETLAHDRYKPVHALQNIADSLPALGIVAAVLGVVHAMGSLDSSPEVLGGLIGAALVGTFSGILLSYGVVPPIAHKIKGCGRSSCACSAWSSRACSPS